jgi:S-adenosylmethionine-diacylgycerolhomoserine-N-methlytransferase
MSHDTEQRMEIRRPSHIENYYRLHSKIYDATRWSFLFGRTAILSRVAKFATPRQILEIGCGTGKNIVDLCRIFPKSQITGIDLSGAMIDIARGKTKQMGSRVRLLNGAYGPAYNCDRAYDLILFSYALSMFNPGFEEAIVSAHRDLVLGGHIAVVDFHDTRFTVFERWMGVNHVRMNGQLRPLLATRFETQNELVQSAYGGVWRYLSFIGKKVA